MVLHIIFSLKDKGDFGVYEFHLHKIKLKRKNLTLHFVGILLVASFLPVMMTVQLEFLMRLYIIIGL